MESQWITEKIMELKRLHNECGMDEIALSRYISYMIRMLNGLAQMEYAEFHFYEKLILRDALEIFVQHFIGQAEVARFEQEVSKKRALLDDIENAVESMTSVYKNVIDSTANSDRQMLSSITIDTSIYELSPKICAFYSFILNKLVKMFEEGSKKYAFVLHPTLRNITETRVMFEQRKESGKVVIIYISESNIEMFDVVSVFLLHESFHVLTKQERKRKKRLGAFIQLMLAGMKQLLFKDIEFDEKEKENLLQIFFSDCKSEAAKWNMEEEEHRGFYSSEVKQWAISYFHKRLQHINISLDEWVRKAIFRDFSGLDYDKFKKKSEIEERCINGIKENLSRVMLENKVSTLSKQFLFLFREIYADIACILTLQLEPDDYVDAFEKSKQFHSDKEYYDSTRIVRNYVVALSVLNYMPMEKKIQWSGYAQKLQSGFSKKDSALSDEKEDKKDSTFHKTYAMLDITPQMQKALREYAKECASAFSRRVESIESIQAFRNYMLNIRNGDKTELLGKIMVGDLNGIF